MSSLIKNVTHKELIVRKIWSYNRNFTQSSQLILYIIKQWEQRLINGLLLFLLGDPYKVGVCAVPHVSPCIKSNVRTQGSIILRHFNHWGIIIIRVSTLRNRTSRMAAPLILVGCIFSLNKIERVLNLVSGKKNYHFNTLNLDLETDYSNYIIKTIHQLFH